MKTVIEEDVDFILLTGDLFDSTVPNLDLANEIFKVLKEVKRNGIRIYMIFGSHDNSRNRQSITKLLSTTEIATYVSEEAMKIGQPEYYIDEQTGVKIVGVDGLTGGVDRYIYEEMDKKKLENEEGYKIFMFPFNFIITFLPSTSASISLNFCLISCAVNPSTKISL